MIILLLSSWTRCLEANGEADNMAPFKESAEITVVFDNNTVDKKFESGYGFACVVEKNGRKMLFDTGCCGKTLLSNLKAAGIKPKEIDAVVLSHSHWDHTGGLFDFLKVNNNVIVYVLPSFSKKFKQEIKNNGAMIKECAGYKEILEGMFTTGELGNKIKEQSLIIDTNDGAILITGCAHPGIVNIIKKAKAFSKKDISVILGGFHLMDKSVAETGKMIASLKALGIKEIIPMHCTGKKQSDMIRKIFCAPYNKLGAGLKVKI